MPSEHATVIASVRNYDNPWQVPRRQKPKWADGMKLKEKGEVLYFAGCSTSLLFPDTARHAVRLIRTTGTDPGYLGHNEKCCGSTARKLGEETLARDKAEQCFEDFKRSGAKLVVTSCPGCASALNHFPDVVGKYNVKVMHISSFLKERLDKSTFSKTRAGAKATFHDPCDLGRELGEYDAPRDLARAAIGADLIEMERSRNTSSCCGSGSGVKSAYSELAGAIGQERVAMARDAGANLIVTSCPWCLQNLRECQGDRKAIEVIDLVDLLEESLDANVGKARRASPS